MNYREPATGMLEKMRSIELALRADDDTREKLNGAVFGVANKIHCRPEELALYILLRTI